MKRTLPLLALLLTFALLTACGAVKGSFTNDEPDLPADTSSVDEPSDDGGGEAYSALFRIVDGAEDGSLTLTGLDGTLGDVYRLSSKQEGVTITLDGAAADCTALEDGMPIRVTWDGSIMETFPARFSGVTAIEGWSLGSAENPAGGYYDLYGLYLQVLDDLWEKDPTLNTEVVALDLSQAPGELTDGEKSAIAWRFGETHGVDAYLSDEAEEGICRLSILAPEADDQIVFSLPTLRFHAEKYAGPLAAYSFYNCTATWPELGTWTGYTVGGEMIS